MLNPPEFSKQVKDLIFYLDDIKGYKLYQQIQKEDRKLINKNEEAEKAFIVLQFLIIPYLSTREIAQLLREKLSNSLKLQDIDLKDRIKKKLIFLDLADRDNCKRELRLALAANKEKIISEVSAGEDKRIRTTEDWIKDYVSHIGKSTGSALEKAQYFYKKQYFVKLPETEKEILKKVFSLYAFLNASSLTPQGFEDDLLLKTEDGKLITTKEGQIVTLYDPKKELATRETATIDKKEEISDKSVAKQKSQSPELQKLQQLANQYPEGSLERRAVEEEIRKFEV